MLYTAYTTVKAYRTVHRKMGLVRIQAVGATTYMPDVTTVSSQDKNERGTTVAEPDISSFHRIISSIAVLAQCFGLLPVRGVTCPSPQALRCAHVVVVVVLLSQVFFLPWYFSS
jgi:hypothetical protein